MFVLFLFFIFHFVIILRLPLVQNKRFHYNNDDDANLDCRASCLICIELKMI